MSDIVRQPVPVAVSMRLAPASGYAEERDAISHDMTALLTVLGLLPIPVPNTTRDPGALLAATGARGIVLTGGDDLGPLAGEGEPAPTLRDLTESALLAAGLQRGLPVLAICRGLQLVNVALGGGLCRDLAAATGEAHVAVEHDVELAEGILDGVATATVNSYHGSGVLAGRLASGAVTLATTAGGVVEAFEHPDLRIVALQWHPERERRLNPLTGALLLRWLGWVRCVEPSR